MTYFVQKRLRSYSTFSKSSTRDMITDFADLRICKLHDNREKVASVYLGKGVWYSIGTKILTDFISSENLKPPSCVGIHPRYVNIRMVKMNGKYTTCSCGIMHSFQSLCIHITSILSETISVTGNMIPIRWWYKFLYYYNSNASSMEPKIAETCKKVYVITG